jgi:hypothetical protein
MMNAVVYRNPDEVDTVGLASADGGGPAVADAPADVESSGVGIEDVSGSDPGDENPDPSAPLGTEDDTPAADEHGDSGTEETPPDAAEGADAFAESAAEYLEFQAWKAGKSQPAAEQVEKPADAPALDVKAIEAEHAKTVGTVAANIAKAFGYKDGEEKEIVDALAAALAPLAAPAIEVAKFKAETAAKQAEATKQAEVRQFFDASREALDLVIDEIGGASVYGAKGADALPSQRKAFEAFAITLNNRARELRALQGGKPLTAEQVKEAAKAVHADLVKLGKAKGTAAAPAPTAKKPAPKLPVHAPANGVKGVRPADSKSEDERIEAEREAAYQRIRRGMN